MYTCPVCGFDQLEDAPTEFSICPCCGTEFDLDDAFATHSALRSAWLRNGAHWWSPVVDPPAAWDAYNQINNLIGASPVQEILGPAVLSILQGLSEINCSAPQQTGRQTRHASPEPSLPTQFEQPVTAIESPLLGIANAYRNLPSLAQQNTRTQGASL